MDIEPKRIKMGFMTFLLVDMIYFIFAKKDDSTQKYIVFKKATSNIVSIQQKMKGYIQREATDKRTL